jgi:flagellar hook-length control protein FliK
VAITLTNDESKNPANAFSALLNLSGVRFKAEHALSTVEGQWLRAKPMTEQDADAKPKQDLKAKPKDKADNDDAKTEDANDTAAPTKAKDDAQDAGDEANAAGTAVGEAQPTDQTAAVGLDVAQAATIQFQILVQLPSGELKDMGTFDLQTLLAAASQDASLASALEAAFAQAAQSLGDNQALLVGFAQAATADGMPALAGAQAGDLGAAIDGDTQTVADLFKQIAAALRPLTQQTQETAKTSTAAPSVAAQATSDDAPIEAELSAPEISRQSAELSRILGDDNKIRIQVVVAGRQVADVPFEWSQFNRYVGYSPEAMRNAALANGMQGVAANPESAPTPSPAAPAAMAPSQSTLQSPSSGPSAAPRGDVTAARAVDAPTQGNANSGSNSSPQGQTSSFATTLNQTANATTTSQAAATDRVPQQAQQVIEQIKVNITRAAKAGLDRVTIQLRPEELGRIEIKLEMSQDGRVSAAITADNPATLDLLQREARGLERALQDAGLRADADNLEFNLRGEGNDRRAENEDANERRGHMGERSGRGAEAETADGDETYDYALAARQRGGVDTYA